MIGLQHHDTPRHFSQRNCSLTAVNYQHTKHSLKVAQKQRKADTLKEKT